MNFLKHFLFTWLIDFEFSQPPGERPSVVCMVARELRSGRVIRMSAGELAGCDKPPFPIDNQTLVVAYYASAECNCFAALGWPMPTRLLDLWVEFRVYLNGVKPSLGWGLLSCLVHHGLDSMLATEKQGMRELAMRGGPYTAQEMTALLDYCQSDVDALAKLMPRMLPHVDLDRALLRGRYMVAVAGMESNGTPIDVPKLQQFRDRWEDVKRHLIAEVDEDFGVYEETTFVLAKFEAYLQRHDIPWPRTPTGRLQTDNETFRQQAKMWPQIEPIRELRSALSDLRLEKLAVGSDGRNRTLLSPFRASSGRNQPSTNQFVFGLSAWLRRLVRPEPGMAVIYIDWSQQELGIAAALSGDQALSDAYRSDDPYLAFARMAGAVPEGATKQSHGQEREVYKVCMLATQYGMGEHGLAAKLGRSTIFARELLLRHRQTFPTFWEWSQRQVDLAMLLGRLETVFGWPVYVGPDPNPRSLANFPMQANGAEMLRLACCLATEAGIRVCCPVHDALLIEAEIDRVNQVVEQTQAFMAEASGIVLGGFTLRSDAKIVRYPDRYADGDRGRVMWDTVQRLAMLPAA